MAAAAGPWGADTMAAVAGLLSIERREAVALVTLQRPEKRNALSIDLRVELAEAFGGLAGDDGVGCIVLTGAGTAFCSGMDVTQFGGDADHKRRLVETSTGAFEAIGSCARPVIAAVNGPALAGGFALALLCDLRIAASSATFGFPELPRGIPPSYASARAALGLAAALKLAATIAAAPRSATLETKRRILIDRRRNFGDLFADEARVFRETLLGVEPDDDPAA